MVYHSVVLDVQKMTSSCILDIVEKDKNSHQLLIKLVCDAGHPYNVSGYTPQIEFFDNSTNTKVLTTAVDIVNAYRGYLSYILGERIVQNPSRYTVSLKLYDNSGSSSARMTCQFILNIIKDPNSSGCDCGCGGSTEVTISKEFYDELKNHLDDRLIHVSESDRAILTYLTDNLDDLVHKSDLEPINQNLSNLNEITDNLTKNLTSLDRTVTNLVDTTTSLARLVEDYDRQIKEADAKSTEALTAVKELQDQTVTKEELQAEVTKEVEIKVPEILSKNLDWVQLVNN